jgi:hypothetical protein
MSRKGGEKKGGARGESNRKQVKRINEGTRRKCEEVPRAKSEVKGV